MSYPKVSVVSSTCMRLVAMTLLAAAPATVAFAAGATKPSAPKAAAPAKAAPKAPSTSASHPASGGAAGNHSAASGTHAGGAGAGGKTGATGGGNKPAVGTTKNANGTSTTHTASGKEVTKTPTGKVASVKTASGHEAKFASNGKVKEVKANGMTVSRGPGGVRRTVVERPDHSRLVAEGHGRGYIQRPYSYGGHAYYSRAYYDHGGYYRGYYRGYYYNGGYYNGYMPAYYYPGAYYGWAYNPWPAPVAYGWGWGGSPWYGYYGAYYAPYPVYPSAAFWLTDYLVAASLANAYAVAVAAGDTAELQHPNPAHLVFASYDPSTSTTSPTMTKEVKDAIADEIKRDLAAQKSQTPGESTPANLGTLLGDGQPHVFVASSSLTVTSSGQDCGLTDGDVLALNAPPTKDATGADLRVLASKQTDCPKGNVVTVEMTDLQEMHNNLLASIDKGMAEMKDNPGKGGLPAPPADVTAGTKEAPYAAAAPAADPNGAAELDQQAKEGAQVEQQVVAEATAPDGSDTAAQPASPTEQPPSAAPAPKGPVTISMGQTPEEVVAAKGQPTSKVNLGTKIIYNYSDMKIIFVKGKVSDVQ